MDVAADVGLDVPSPRDWLSAGLSVGMALSATIGMLVGISEGDVEFAMTVGMSVGDVEFAMVVIMLVGVAVVEAVGALETVWVGKEDGTWDGRSVKTAPSVLGSSVSSFPPSSQSGIASQSLAGTMLPSPAGQLKENEKDSYSHRVGTQSKQVTPSAEIGQEPSSLTGML